MRKSNCILVMLIIWMLLFISGCQGSSDIARNNIHADCHSSEIRYEEKTPSADDHSSEIAYEEKTPSDVFVYKFNPNVISEEYKTIYGEEIDEEFFSFCDAILKKEKIFPCRSQERFYQLLSISNSCFPIAQELINKEKSSFNAGICHFVYRYSDEKLDELILAFEEKVTDVIRLAVPYDEPDYIKAMELFTAVANKDAYDDSYTLEESLKLRSYRSIMEDIGICQEIEAEYIYYLLQVGIDAFPCSSLNADQSEAHEWTMVKLEGNYYHMDPTYAINYPNSLYFFGMDDIQREYYGDYPKENYTYAASDVLSDCTATDRRFEKMWLAEKYEIDHIGRKIVITENNTGNRCEYDFEVFQ